MLQEAGFHPLEVIRSATLNGAETLHEPKGKQHRLRDHPPGPARPTWCSSIRTRCRTSRSLYATGAVKLNDAERPRERVGGIEYSIKDGIVYDAKKLAADVAAIVERAKRRTSTTAGQQ